MSGSRALSSASRSTIARVAVGPDHAAVGDLGRARRPRARARRSGWRRRTGRPVRICARVPRCSGGASSSEISITTSARPFVGEPDLADRRRPGARPTCTCAPVTSWPASENCACSYVAAARRPRTTIATTAIASDERRDRQRPRRGWSRAPHPPIGARGLPPQKSWVPSRPITWMPRMLTTIDLRGGRAHARPGRRRRGSRSRRRRARRRSPSPSPLMRASRRGRAGSGTARRSGSSRRPRPRRSASPPRGRRPTKPTATAIM